MTLSQQTRLYELVREIDSLGLQNRIDNSIANLASGNINKVLLQDDGVGAFNIIRVWKSKPFSEFVNILSQGVEKIINT